ncbi:Uncharacterised protein [Pseudomonas luteola]|uniref:Uncharacterized protein n=2 Tax=Pseudomonas TaxID=286 RepID=A0A2X2CD59_PSELU|nr:hypothetical protein SAMN05216409_12321 [Pseudomonas lutea]SPZ05073.1 Uncharacterised protein [Pseudomonas luteola]
MRSLDCYTSIYSTGASCTQHVQETIDRNIGGIFERGKNQVCPECAVAVRTLQLLNRHSNEASKPSLRNAVVAAAWPSASVSTSVIRGVAEIPAIKLERGR